MEIPYGVLWIGPLDLFSFWIPFTDPARVFPSWLNVTSFHGLNCAFKKKEKIDQLGVLHDMLHDLNYTITQKSVNLNQSTLRICNSQVLRLTKWRTHIGWNSKPRALPIWVLNLVSMTYWIFDQLKGHRGVAISVTEKALGLKARELLVSHFDQEVGSEVPLYVRYHEFSFTFE